MVSRVATRHGPWPAPQSEPASPGKKPPGTREPADAESCMSSRCLSPAITWSLPRGTQPGITSGYYFLAELTFRPNEVQMDAVRAGSPAHHSSKRTEEGCSPRLKQHTRSPVPRAAGAGRDAPASAEQGGTRRAPARRGKGSAALRLTLQSLLPLFMTCTHVKR